MIHMTPDLAVGTAKIVTTRTVRYSVKTTLGAIVVTGAMLSIPNAKPWQKVTAGIAAYVISSMVAKNAEKWAITEFDNTMRIFYDEVPVVTETKETPEA